MVGLPYISFPPCVEIEDVHPVGPRTFFRIQVLRNKWVGEVEVVLKTLGHHPLVLALACLHSPINMTLKVNLPERGQVPLDHNIIIQEDNLVKVWEKLPNTKNVSIFVCICKERTSRRKYLFFECKSEEISVSGQIKEAKCNV